MENKTARENLDIDFGQYVSLFWKWFWLVALCALVSGGIAYWITTRSPLIYRASSTLLISGNSNEVASDYRAILAAENLLPTYAEQLTGRVIRRKVESILELESWTSDVTTKLIKDTQLMLLTVEDEDPKRAMEIANLIPVVFIQHEKQLQDERLTNAEETLSAQLASVQKEIDTINAALNEENSQSDPNPAEVDRLESQLYEYQASQAAFTHSYQEIRLAQVQLFSPLMISEPADLPTAPVKRNTLQNSMMSSVIGGMFAIGIAFLIEYLDNTFKTPDDVQRVLGFNPLGVIPKYPENGTSQGPICSTQPRSPIAETYRILRTNLQLRTVDNPAKSILVTSSVPFEGKSNTALNLAIVMAQADLSVILVDIDLRRPVLHRLMNQANIQGVTTALLAKDSEVQKHLQTTRIKNIKVLTTGPLPPNPSELLSSKRLKKLVEILKTKADVVIFDSSPLLAVADAAVLTSVVDGVLFVIGVGESHKSDSIRAQDLMGEIGANLLGVVLTKYSPSQGDRYYYYGYYQSENKRNRNGREPSSVSRWDRLKRKFKWRKN